MSVGEMYSLVIKKVKTKFIINFTVRMRLGWKPSFPHPQWERHHPLGSKAQMQRLNGGR